MTTHAPSAIVLAAGMGTRMKSQLPKVMHPLAGRPMVDHVLASLSECDVETATIVIGPELEGAASRFAPHRTAVQRERLGTGHAVRTALEGGASNDGTILIVYGDVPLLTPATLSRLLDRCGQGAALALLVFRPETPGAYGRVIVNGDQVERIVEALDATPEELEVDLCNSGVMAVSGPHLKKWVNALKNDNAKGEYYLTDIVAMARADSETCAVVEGGGDELVGINNRADLAEAERIIQDRYRAAAMAAGVTLQDPSSVFLSYDTAFGTDVNVAPFTVFGPGVAVGSNVTIKGFCHFEQATIRDGVTIGPYARLRPGAELAQDSHVGNFVEIKNATVEQGAKVNHLSYIGDARVGKGSNVGAGTITANYDGYNKSHTDIGENVSIGSNTVLVAPVKVGDGAVTGAGAVVRKDVPSDAIALTDAPQKNREGMASKYRAQRKAIKDSKAKGK